MEEEEEEEERTNRRTARIWDVTRDSNTGKLVSSSTTTNNASSITPEGNSGDGGTRIDPTISLIGQVRQSNGSSSSKDQLRPGPKKNCHPYLKVHML